MKHPQILYEDNHLLCLNKPAGITTQPQADGSISLEEIAKAYIKERDHKPGNVYLHAIHRLDKPTSGIVVFAKTKKALTRMQEALRKREIKKTYLALVEGILKKKRGTVEIALRHDAHKAEVDTTKGKKSCLTYTVLEEHMHHSLVAIELITGRYHQIRATFSYLRHPIIGDKKYGSATKYFPHSIGLHHAKMSFMHPIKQVLITIEAHDIHTVNEELVS